MSWQLLEKPVTLRVTKKLAKEFAEMEAAPHDRPLSERRLQVYQRMFTQGLFRPVTWAKAFCISTSGTYRVNGKHTSVLLSGLDEIPEFYIIIESYICDDLEDVAKLYSTFDSKTMTRTAHDINLSFAAALPELASISANVINKVVAGMDFHLAGGYTNPKLSVAERAERLLEYPEFVLWLSDFIGPKGVKKEGRNTTKHIARASVVAAMFGTWLKAKQASTDFWTAVRDETGDKPSLPDRKLARFLLSVGVERGFGTNRIKHAEPKEFYAKCIHAWNAWRKGETTELKYYADKPAPSIK